MAVSKQQKIDILNDLIERFKSAKSIWFATTNTLTVKEFTILRKKLREVNTSYNLAKKTLIKKAAYEVFKIDISLENLEWQIWVICSNNDSISWLWKTNEFIKEINWKKWDLGKMSWSSSIFEWTFKDKNETIIISSIPSRESLLWRLIWSMISPISWLARFFDAASKKMEENWKIKLSELEWNKETN